MSEDRAVFEAALTAKERGERVALATVVNVTGSVPRHAGSKMLVRQDGTIVGTVGGGAMESLVIKEALAAIQDGRTRLPSYSLNDLANGDPGICGGTVQVFIEPVGASPTLLVIGGGHVGKALAELGLWSGWRVILSDDRAAFCNPDYVKDLAGYIVCKPSQVTEQVNINAQTYIAAVTRGLPVDIDLIPALLATEAAYIGLIGSRRRWALTMKALREERGLQDSDFKRIYAPIGLELNAETPQEIAISIMAQVTMLRYGGDGKVMRRIVETPLTTDELQTAEKQ
ncbi:MAG: xanthine dehydrogenase [Anaerolineaceae bacterium]|nr:xanthine dehydrogenase [Anaerolineaceae bacterium]